tara:strand:- start:309 stop:491 length:183 start_codon:yes stop_codon:yes gene_type:complete
MKLARMNLAVINVLPRLGALFAVGALLALFAVGALLALLAVRTLLAVRALLAAGPLGCDA